MSNIAKWTVGIIILVLVVVGVVASSGGNADQATEKNEPIKVGYITFTSGELALPGKIGVAAAELAVNNYNKNREQGARKLDLVVEDYAYKAKEALPAYSALKNNGIDLFLLAGSPAANVVTPEVRKDDNFVITGITTSPSYTDQNQLTCRVGMTAPDYAKAMSDYLREEFETPEVALLVSDDDYGQAMKSELESQFSDGSGEIALSTSYPAGDGDFRTQLTKLEGSQDEYDSLVVVQTGNAIVPMTKQISQIGIEKPILIDGVTAGSPFFTDKSFANGWTAVDYGFRSELDSDQIDEVQKFKQDYASSTQYDPTLAAAVAHDQMAVVADAIGETGDTTPQGVASYLTEEMGEYTGASGNFTFDSDCEVDRPVVYREIVDGEFQTLNN